MDESQRRLAITASVFTGALLLFGPATFSLLVTAVDVLAGLAGIERVLDGTSGIVIGVPAVLAAVEVVAEVTAIQLYGFGALWRGSRRRRLVRHLVLSSVVVAAFVATVGLGVGWAREADDSTVPALAGLLGLAILWAGTRTLQAFRSGYASGEK